MAKWNHRKKKGRETRKGNVMPAKLKSALCPARPPWPRPSLFSAGSLWFCQKGIRNSERMAGTMFRGVSLDQDKRFKDKDEKELRKREFPPNFAEKVNLIFNISFMKIGL